jgi:hypothetical protein
VAQPDAMNTTEIIVRFCSWRSGAAGMVGFPVVFQGIVQSNRFGNKVVRLAAPSPSTFCEFLLVQGMRGHAAICGWGRAFIAGPEAGRAE